MPASLPTPKASAMASRASLSDCSSPSMPGGGAGLGEGGAVGDVGAGEVVGGAVGLALVAPAPSEMLRVTVVFAPS